MQENAELGDLSSLLQLDEPLRKPAPPRDPRLLTIFRVGKLTTDRFEELCLVRNVGVGGIMAHVHSPLVPRQRVRIELRSDWKLWGHVLWAKDGTAGIGFDSQVDIEEILARSPAGSDDRRSSGPRLNIDCGAKLRVGSRYYGVRVHNLGQTGVGVLSTQKLEEDQEVVVTLEGFRAIHGSVRWRRNHRAGISFNQPIPFNELIRWLRDMFGRTCVETRRATR